jgi:hypothetical protein
MLIHDFNNKINSHTFSVCKLIIAAEFTICKMSYVHLMPKHGVKWIHCNILYVHLIGTETKIIRILLPIQRAAPKHKSQSYLFSQSAKFRYCRQRCQLWRVSTGSETESEKGSAESFVFRSHVQSHKFVIYKVTTSPILLCICVWKAAIRHVEKAQFQGTCDVQVE